MKELRSQALCSNCTLVELKQIKEDATDEEIEGSNCTLVELKQCEYKLAFNRRGF